MIYINAALSSGLLWDDVSVYYTCKNNTDNGYFQVSYFYVGCSPGRHIVVERTDTVLMNLKKFLWNPTDEDQ
ncbi:hypothetical protein QYF61_011467, partial [Mycteria americana]